DLVFVVVNYSEALTNEDEDLFRAVQGKDFIVIVNKTDLPQAIDMERVIELAEENRVITTSLIEEQGIDGLETAIADLFFEGTIDSADVTYFSNARHIGL
ncbi:tRNA uridine-5-carboxymethylaminomethyl(34) synthesis GTPase MnmE, partial [Bacillus tropicus]|nr:tRNA uridine-5-carboxymethylaminomethyl(34) synthesis GTPase MnmE [Bacillus tropicus]